MYVHMYMHAATYAEVYIFNLFSKPKITMELPGSLLLYKTMYYYRLQDEIMCGSIYS